MKLDFDAIIIGTGVAGMTTAIYLKRAGIDCCLIEKKVPGGQINLSPKVKNYPGFVEISGSELSSIIFNQTQELGIHYINSEVIKFGLEGDIKIVKLADKTLKTKFIIIATGRHPRKLDIPNVNLLVGKGLSYCATCDGNFFKEMNVVVIGGGNSALEEALYLSNICKNVTIINRSNKLRGEEYYKNKIDKAENINIKYNSIVKELKLENDRLNSILIEENGKEKELFAKGCFTYIGYEPSTDFIDNIELDANGYIVVDKENQTNIENVYAAGDVVNKSAFQLLTAMNDGVVVATSIIKKIK